MQTDRKRLNIQKLCDILSSFVGAIGRDCFSLTRKALFVRLIMHRFIDRIMIWQHSVTKAVIPFADSCKVVQKFFVLKISNWKVLLTVKLCNDPNAHAKAPEKGSQYDDSFTKFWQLLRRACASAIINATLKSRERNWKGIWMIKEIRLQ